MYDCLRRALIIIFIFFYFSLLSIGFTDGLFTGAGFILCMIKYPDFRIFFSSKTAREVLEGK